MRTERTIKVKNNQRTQVKELRPSMWPVCDQERELHCVRHITDEVRVRRFDSVLYDFELRMNAEAVTVFVPAPVAHQVSIVTLKKAGMRILLDDGNKILYVG